MDKKYDSIIGKKFDKLTKEEQRLMYDKHYVTDGLCYWIKRKFYVSHGSGKVLGVFELNELEEGCKKLEIENKGKNLVPNYYQNPNIPQILDVA